MNTKAHRITKGTARGVLATVGTTMAVLGGGSALSVESADAAIIRSYADGPVLYLSKDESRIGAAGTAAGAATLIAGATGGWGAAGGAALAAMSTAYVDRQAERGRCVQIKMIRWNPNRIAVGFYSWWPCY